MFFVKKDSKDMKDMKGMKVMKEIARYLVTVRRLELFKG
jgi:hypothetical protein